MFVLEKLVANAFDWTESNDGSWSRLFAMTSYLPVSQHCEKRKSTCRFYLPGLESQKNVFN